MNIRTVAFDNSEQIDWSRDSGPHAITVVLEDGRVIIVNGDGIVVLGPDSETLYEGPLPRPGYGPNATLEQYLASRDDAPAGAGAIVEAERG
jgi:hypothetical protein